MYGKTYKHQKDDNFKAFLDSLGIGEDKVQAILNSKPSQKLDKNGDDYVLTLIDSQKPKELKFKNGVEFDDDIGENLNGLTRVWYHVHKSGDLMMGSLRNRGDSLKFVWKDIVISNFSEAFKAKTTFTIDGNVVKQVQKFADGRSLFYEHKYTDNTLVVTLKSSFWDGTAHRHFVAA